MSLRRVQAGFDVNIFGIKWSGGDLDPPAEYWLVYTKLQDVIDAVRRDDSHGCSIILIPLGSNIVLDTRNDLQPFAMLRIRITQNRDVHEPAGHPEQHALQAVEAQLKALGIAAAEAKHDWGVRNSAVRKPACSLSDPEGASHV